MISTFDTVGDTLVFCLRNCLCSNTFEIWILRILLYSSTLRNWPSRIGLNMILWIAGKCLSMNRSTSLPFKSNLFLVA